MRLLVCFLAVLLGSAAHAAEQDCTGVASLSDGGSVMTGTINKAAPRANFVRNASDRKSCPSAAPGCLDRRYLVPGDAVLVNDGPAQGAYRCVTFVNRKGDAHSGWIDKAAIDMDAPAAVTAKDWLGKWSGDEQEIVIKAARKPGAIAVAGDATYGANDPDRVKRGAVNMGSIAGEVAPKDAAAAFAMSGDATVSVSKAAEGDCKVWMRRAGPWLVVDDNNACGGMNVTFRGIYRRR